MKEQQIHLFLSAAGVFFGIWSMVEEFISFEDYKISLWGIQHSVHYEDVQGRVFTTFSTFQSFACSRTRNEGVLTVCGSLITFQISGIILFLATMSQIFLTIFGIYAQYQQNYSLPMRSLSPALYFIASITYFAMNSQDVLDSHDQKLQISYELGCFLIVILNITGLISIFMHVYMQRSVEFQRLQEPHLQSTEEIPYSKRLGSEPEALNSLGQDNQLARMDTENKELKEKLRKINEKHWETLNELTESIEAALKDFRIKGKVGDISKFESIERTLHQLSTDFLGAEHGKWESEREELRNSVKLLMDQLEENKHFVNKSEESIRNELFNLEAERNILIQKLQVIENERLSSEAEGLRLTESTGAEFTKLFQELEAKKIEVKKAQGIAQDKTLRVFELEQALEVKVAKEAKLLEQIQDLKRILKEEFPISANISDIESEAFNEQLSFFTEAIKKSRCEMSQMEQKSHNLEEKNEALRLIIKEFEQKYVESLKEVEYLKKTVQELSLISSEHKKTIDDLNMSSLVDLLKDQDSKATEERTILEEKYRKCKTDKKLLSKELKSAKKQLDSLKPSSESEITALSSRLQAEEDEWERIKAELVYSNSQLSKEVEAMQNRLKSQETFFEGELQKAQLDNASLSDDVKKFKELSEAYKLEYERVKDFEEVLKAQIPKEVGDFKALLEEQSLAVAKSLGAYEERINLIIKEKEKLRKKLQKTENELQTIAEEYQTLHKARITQKRDETLSFSSVESHSVSIRDSLIIEGVSPSIIFHNPLIEKITKLRKEPPMTYSTLWKTLESFLLEKLKADKLDPSREPRALPEFALDFMSQKYGLKALALKQLKALITSLEELYKLSHPYAQFFCRLLGIFHPRPIPSRVASYLLSLQELFIQISQKLNTKQANLSEIYEVQQFGGEASIVAVMELVKRAFVGNRAAGERVLDRLHADQPDKLEMTILKICGRLSSVGLNDEAIFGENHKDLDYHEFVDGIRLRHDVWVSVEEAEALCVALDERQKGVVSWEAWKKKIFFEEYAKKVVDKAAMVTKADFLNSVVCEYEFQLVEEFYELKRSVKVAVLDPEEASRLFVRLDPNLGLDAQERLFKEAVANEGGKGESVSVESVCMVLIKHAVGGVGRGMFTAELLQQALEVTS